ncbi:putative prothymosin alpha-like [Sciurus carolinensis]|uniref:Prothymosin alpha n=1 Tax=Sciurus carolinensis TaxID=30640 RepID=A0AA41TA42_SCICA|nr:putative prothymosin alpha-like [Sciurus carolinensis]
MGSPTCLTKPEAAMDTRCEITTKDLKEEKEVMEEAKRGREALLKGMLMRKMGSQRFTVRQLKERREVMVRKRVEMKTRRPRQPGHMAAAEDEDDVDTKTQKTDEDD